MLCNYFLIDCNETFEQLMAITKKRLVRTSAAMRILTTKNTCVRGAHARILRRKQEEYMKSLTPEQREKCEEFEREINDRNMKGSCAQS